MEWWFVGGIVIGWGIAALVAARNWLLAQRNLERIKRDLNLP